VEDIEAFRRGRMGRRNAAQRGDAVAVYCRVSGRGGRAKADLDRQKGRVLAYCAEKGYNAAHIFAEVGSGMSDTRTELLLLLGLAAEGGIARVVVEHKDRLTRFGFNILKKYFESHGVAVECIRSEPAKAYASELVDDMAGLLASFSARVSRKRVATKTAEVHSKEDTDAAYDQLTTPNSQLDEDASADEGGCSDGYSG
jgi:predicted site-specific integrase-resolvase